MQLNKLKYLAGKHNFKITYLEKDYSLVIMTIRGGYFGDKK